MITTVLILLLMFWSIIGYIAFTFWTEKITNAKSPPWPTLILCGPVIWVVVVAAFVMTVVDYIRGV
jgi:hypothetical protein